MKIKLLNILLFLASINIAAQMVFTDGSLEENAMLASASTVDSHPWSSVFPVSDLPLPTTTFSTASGATKYVKIAPTGDGSGTDWDNALGASDLKATIEAGGTVYIAEGTYSLGSQIDLSINVCVIGGYPNSATGTEVCSNYAPITNQTILDGANSHRLMRHNNVAADSLELRGLVLQNGNPSSGGGSAFYSAVSSTSPMAIHLIDLEVKNNTSNSHGAIFIGSKTNVDTEILIKNCNFRNNTGSRGGAISFYTVRNSTSSTYANPGKLVIEDCFFYTNIANGSGGGAISIEQSHQWTLRRNTFCSNNASPQNGGAIRFYSTYKTEVLDCEFGTNYSDTDGGAIYANSADLTISNSTFLANNAGNTESGGAIFGTSSSGIQLDSSSFYNNYAGSGGAIFWRSALSVSIPNQATNNIFVNNSAIEASNSNLNGGGAIKMINADWIIENNFFVDNSVDAAGFGGAINIYDLDVELTNNLFYNNQIGSSNSILGADIIAYNSSANFSPAADNKMQLSSAAIYLPQTGASGADDYDFTNDTFGNTDDGSLDPAPAITCPTALETSSLLAGCPAPPEIFGNGIDDNQDGRIDEPYPGGVQTNLQLWLDAEEGTNTDVTGTDVTSWADRSTNFFSANADASSTDNPTYSNNAINYHPGVSFDGTYTDLYSDGLHLGSDYIYSDKGGMQIFSVVEHESTGNSFANVYDFGHGASEVVGLNWTHIYSKNQTPTSHGGADESYFHHTGSYPCLVSLEIDFETDQSLLKNGTVLQTTAIPSLSQITANEIAESSSFGSTTDGPVTIGRQSSSFALSQSRIFNGAISEVLVYDDTLSVSDQEKVNSYLAMKYGLTLSHDYVFSDGTLIKDITDGYANNISGIAVDSAGALDQRQSKSINSSSIISVAHSYFAVSNSSNLSPFSSDKSALVWGDNGAAENASWNGTNYDIPSGGYLGIDRIWRFEETNAVQSIAFRVDVDDADFDLPALPAYPASDGAYYLFIDDDGDFTNGGTTVQSMALVAGSLWGTIIADPTDSYFSIGMKIPEICNNGLDDDGDGDIDCLDADCTTTYYAAAQTSTGVSSPSNVLGAPDFLAASLGDDDQITIDLGSTLDIGEEYTLNLIASSGSMIVEESIDGINYFAALGSPYSLSGSIDITIATGVRTRYIRITIPSTGINLLFLDAISYDNCICAPASSLVGEYAINTSPDVTSNTVTIDQGDSLTLDFVGIFNTEIFIWTGPNALYQVNDSGTFRDHLYVGDIQANQAGEYKAYYFDTVGCVDTSSFQVTVLGPEICNNGLDDDGDGDTDGDDSDCCTAQAPVLNKK